jgi:hypothetical protein
VSRVILGIGSYYDLARRQRQAGNPFLACHLTHDARELRLITTPGYQRQALRVRFQKIDRACLGTDGSQDSIHGKLEPLLQIEGMFRRDADGIVDRQFAVSTHDLCRHFGALGELALRRFVQVRMMDERAHLLTDRGRQRDLVDSELPSVAIGQTQETDQPALGNERYAS